MPTYEYACRDCGRHLEVVQSFADKPLTKCPSCGGALKKVFSPVGIVLKGSGFYKTDSRSGSGKGAKKEKEPSTSGASSSSSSSSDSGSSSSSSSSDSKSSSDSGAKTKKSAEKSA